MNPMLMQVWMVAFEVALKAARATAADYPGAMSAEDQGYQAALYAESVLTGARRAADEAKVNAGKVVKL